MGEMIAGILLGPSLLGLVAPSLQAALFPPESLSVLSVVSQLGLVLYMFVVGTQLRDRFHPPGLPRRAVDLTGGNHRAVRARRRTRAVSSPGRPIFRAGGLELAEHDVPRRRDVGDRVSRPCAHHPRARHMPARRWVRWRSPQARPMTPSRGAFWQSSWRASIRTSAIAVSAIVGGALYAAAGARRASAAACETGSGPLSATGASGQAHSTLVLGLLMAGAWFTDAIGIHAVFGAFIMGVAMPRGPVSNELGRQIEPLAPRLSDSAVFRVFRPQHQDQPDRNAPTLAHCCSPSSSSPR